MGIAKSIIRGILRTFRCKKCRYVWNSRRPHSRLNPPSHCPRCGERL